MTSENDARQLLEQKVEEQQKDLRLERKLHHETHRSTSDFYRKHSAATEKIQKEKLIETNYVNKLLQLAQSQQETAETRLTSTTKTLTSLQGTHKETLQKFNILQREANQTALKLKTMVKIKMLMNCQKSLRKEKEKVTQQQQLVVEKQIAKEKKNNEHQANFSKMKKEHLQASSSTTGTMMSTCIVIIVFMVVLVMYSFTFKGRSVKLSNDAHTMTTLKEEEEEMTKAQQENIELRAKLEIKQKECNEYPQVNAHMTSTIAEGNANQDAAVKLEMITAQQETIELRAKLEMKQKECNEYQQANAHMTSTIAEGDANQDAAVKLEMTKAQQENIELRAKLAMKQKECNESQQVIKIKDAELKETKEMKNSLEQATKNKFAAQAKHYEVTTATLTTNHVNQVEQLHQQEIQLQHAVETQLATLQQQHNKHEQHALALQKKLQEEQQLAVLKQQQQQQQQQQQHEEDVATLQETATIKTKELKLAHEHHIIRVLEEMHMLHEKKVKELEISKNQLEKINLLKMKKNLHEAEEIKNQLKELKILKNNFKLQLDTLQQQHHNQHKQHKQHTLTFQQELQAEQQHAILKQQKHEEDIVKLQETATITLKLVEEVKQDEKFKTEKKFMEFQMLNEQLKKAHCDESKELQIVHEYQLKKELKEMCMMHEQKYEELMVWKYQLEKELNESKEFKSVHEEHERQLQKELKEFKVMYQHVKKKLIEKDNVMKQYQNQLQEVRSELDMLLTSGPTTPTWPRTPTTPKTPRTPPTMKKGRKQEKKSTALCSSEFVKLNTSGLFRRKISHNSLEKTTKSLANQKEWASSFKAHRKNSLISNPCGDPVDSFF